MRPCRGSPCVRDRDTAVMMQFRWPFDQLARLPSTPHLAVEGRVPGPVERARKCVVKVVSTTTRAENRHPGPAKSLSAMKLAVLGPSNSSDEALFTSRRSSSRRGFVKLFDH